MLGKPEIHQAGVQVSLDDLLGPLGYKNKEDVETTLLQQIIAEQDRCRQTLRPQFIVDAIALDPGSGSETSKAGIPDLHDEFLAEHLDGALFLAAGVCTVGEGIDRLVDDCFAQGDYLGAMIADVVGSRAVEDLGEICSDYLCSGMAERDLFPLCRISPGYGQWEVSGQRVLFSLLDPTPIGVSLNEYCMMQPKKSLSFLIPFGKGGSERRLKQPCQECNFKKCAYRRR